MVSVVTVVSVCRTLASYTCTLHCGHCVSGCRTFGLVFLYVGRWSLWSLWSVFGGLWLPSYTCTLSCSVVSAVGVVGVVGVAGRMLATVAEETGKDSVTVEKLAGWMEGYQIYIYIYNI